MTKSTVTDPVSDADRVAETAIVDVIRRARPEDEIVSEEGGGTPGHSGVRWLVDPLDGTVNYLYGIPQWSVSIAALDAEGALAAVVLDPAKGECFRAERGGGAWCGDHRLRVTTLAELSLALVVTGFSYDREERAAQARRQVELAGRVRDLRRLGSAALDLCWVAAARVDGYLELFGNEWDWAAGRLIVVEAGGVVSDVVGVRRGVPGIVASGPGIHDALVRSTQP